MIMDNSQILDRRPLPVGTHITTGQTHFRRAPDDVVAETTSLPRHGVT